MSAPTGIIILIVALIIVKVLLLIYVIRRRRQKKEERAARGCHVSRSACLLYRALHAIDLRHTLTFIRTVPKCFDDVDYYCLPIWYWSSDRGCHCSDRNQPQPNTNPTELEAGYNIDHQRTDREGSSGSDSMISADRKGINGVKMSVIR